MFPRSETVSVGVVPYLMAGFPDRERCLTAAHSLVSLGISALELGIPFSDPLFDGPVIQAASQSALEAGMTVGGCIDLAAAIGGTVPIVFMTSVNPILSYGVDRFAADAASAGISGVLVPDLPPEEADSVAAALRGRGLATIFLVAPTSSDERIAAICAASTGFVYCVTVNGITGFRAELPAGVGELLERVRVRTELPVAAGFGISRPEHLQALRGRADVAVVGTAVVNEVAEGRDPARLVGELLAACP